MLVRTPGHPGLGDEIFNNDHGPLTSISASPPGSAIKPHIGNRSSFDSIIDDGQRLSQEDLLFEKTRYHSSVFNDDYPFQNDGLLPPNQLFWPLLFTVSDHSPMKEDDTMISVSSILIFLLVTNLQGCILQMLGGKHVCR